MEISGKIIAVLASRSGVSRNGSEWKVQEYVLETQEQYPRKMAFEVFGSEKINSFGIKEGELLTVSFDIDAREWNGRWFNSVRAWKVERGVATAQPTAPAQQPQQAAAPNFPPVGTPLGGSVKGDNQVDDLPF